MNVTFSRIFTNCYRCINAWTYSTLTPLQKNVAMIAFACIGSISLGFSIYRYYIMTARNIIGNRNEEQKKTTEVAHTHFEEKDKVKEDQNSEKEEISITTKDKEKLEEETNQKFNTSESVTDLANREEVSPLEAGSEKDLIDNEQEVRKNSSEEHSNSEGMEDECAQSSDCDEVIHKSDQSIEDLSKVPEENAFSSADEIDDDSESEGVKGESAQSSDCDEVAKSDREKDIEEEENFSEEESENHVLPREEVKENSITDGKYAIFDHIQDEQEKLKIQVNIQMRLQKNCNYAVSQQKSERSAKFSITKDLIPNSLNFPLQSEGGMVDRPLNEEEKEMDGMSIGISSCQGVREEMEDAHYVSKISFQVDGKSFQAHVLGIFDGHNGAVVADYLSHNLGRYLQQALQLHNPKTLSEEGVWNAIKTGFIKLNDGFKEERGGATATVAIILEKKIWIANVGDSRTILVKDDGTTIQTTEDAKPNMDRYRKGIEKLGGYVLRSRVNFVLATARAFGDKSIKGEDTGECCVSAKPKITNYSLDDFKNGYLVLACDGLYDVASSNQVGQAIKQMADQKATPKEMAKRLVHSAIASFSGDNISVIVARL